MRRGAPTIYHVAERAGVSLATVSRVNRGTTPVTPETRLRVLRAIEELRYTPSRLGRSLAEGRHDATGIVFPDMSGPYYSEVILGYEEAATAAGHSVLILATHGRPGARHLVLDLAARVDGMVLMGRTVDDELVAHLEERGTPAVLLARPPVGTADVVRSGNRRSAEAITGHLLGHGRRSLAFVGDPNASPDAHARWKGFLAAHRRLAVPIPRSPVRCSYREHEGRAAVAELLAAANPPDGLVCANDEIALGAYTAAREAELEVGVHLAVSGWDDILAARLITPPLTTVRQPMRQLGSTAARLLIERIENPRREARRVVLPTTPVIRASCGCHPT
ncbi:MAG: LacI family DNA-binding transcriptional regulator [Acidimicrobiia bacterium]